VKRILPCRKDRSSQATRLPWLAFLLPALTAIRFAISRTGDTRSVSNSIASDSRRYTLALATDSSSALLGTGRAVRSGIGGLPRRRSSRRNAAASRPVSGGGRGLFWAGDGQIANNAR